MNHSGYRALKVWQWSIDLVEQVYAATRGFPDDERFGLTSQMGRAAVSIPSNIAEGYGRSRSGDYARYLRIARGSLLELETQITISVRLGFMPRKQGESLWKDVQSTGRMLSALIKRVEAA